jgi:large subunit ribosomal protein L9
MAKELLLLADVDELGGEGEIVRVADGFARNYLLPQGKATLVTAGTRRLVEKKKAERLARLAAQKEAAAGLAAQLSKLNIEIPAKVGENGRLFGSITANDVLAALEKVGVKLDKKQLDMTTPIRALGEHSIHVKAHADVDAQVTVRVIEEA